MFFAIHILLLCLTPFPITPQPLTQEAPRTAPAPAEHAPVHHGCYMASCVERP